MVKQYDTPPLLAIYLLLAFLTLHYSISLFSYQPAFKPASPFNVLTREQILEIIQESRLSMPPDQRQQVDNLSAELFSLRQEQIETLIKLQFLDHHQKERLRIEKELVALRDKMREEVLHPQQLYADKPNVPAPVRKN